MAVADVAQAVVTALIIVIAGQFIIIESGKRSSLDLERAAQV